MARGLPKGLSIDGIVDAAFEVLDDQGIDGLTVRAVADRLGVKAPALYWHVRNKQQLLDEMGTRVWRDIAAATADPATDPTADPAAGLDWRTAMLGYARHTRAGLLAHRDGARSFSGTFLTDDAMLADQERRLAWMRDQGFPVEATVDAFVLLTSFVVGYCIEEQERRQSPTERYSLERRDERVGAAEHPLVAAAGRRLFGDPDEHFEALVGMLLDGIAARHARAAHE